MEADETKTLAEWAREERNNDAAVSSVALAWRAMDECPREMLLPVISDAIEHAWRVEARSMERAALEGAISNLSPGSAESLVPPAGAGASGFAAILGQQFALGTGERVTWAAATVEQHRERIEFLGRMMRGIADTIARHEEAITLIQASGVTTLAEALSASAAA